VRSVARRAGLSPATAYSYFRSKEHLLTEVYWQRLREAPPARIDNRRSAGARVAAALRPHCLAVADEPRLAAAVTTSVLAHDPDVQALRQRIGVAYGKRILDALAGDATPALMRVLVQTFAGAMISAGTGVLAYGDIPPLMAEATMLMVGR
jgi:AcrR family transcriptional regulator